VSLAQGYDTDCHQRGRGHRGAKRTYLEHARQYPTLPVTLAWVHDKIDQCGLCQKFKADIDLALKTSRHILTADHHCSQISIDVTTMEEDSAGKDTCYVICNHNTKLVYLYASKGKEELNTISAVLSYIGYYGIMETILVDPGGEFSGTFTAALMDKLGVKWKITIAEKPQSHGTERTVGRVLDAVRLIIAEGGGPWTGANPNPALECRRKRANPASFHIIFYVLHQLFWGPLV